MIILPCLPVILSGSYMTSIFLLLFVFGIIFSIIRGVIS